MSQSATHSDDPWISRDGFKVIALFTGGERPAVTPTLTIVAGQPGSGKTVALHGEVGRLPQREGWTLIDRDRLSQTHDDYAPTEADKGTDYARLKTAKHADLWSERLISDAIASRRHVAIEASDPDVDVGAVAAKFAAKGYRTRLVMLAVPEHVSRQAIVARELEERKAKGSGRHVSSGEHDRAYARWPIVLQKHLAKRTFDEVSVQVPNRASGLGCTEIASSARDGKAPPAGGVSRGAHPLVEALVTERVKPVDPERISRHSARWEMLAESLVPGRRSALYEQDKKDRERLASTATWRHRREGRLVIQALAPMEGPEHVALNISFMRTAPKEPAAIARPTRKGLFGISL